MQEGTTLRVTVADRPYGDFYDFYSVNLKNFGYRLVCFTYLMWTTCWKPQAVLTAVVIPVAIHLLFSYFAT